MENLEKQTKRIFTDEMGDKIEIKSYADSDMGFEALNRKYVYLNMEQLKELRNFINNHIAIHESMKMVNGVKFSFPLHTPEIGDALRFVKWLMELPIDKICIENPVGIISTKIRKPDQIIQPWMFGHGEMKRTCLWLQGLPLLEPTNVVDGRENRIANMPDSKGRSLRRSLFYPGIADAMASQWG